MLLFMMLQFVNNNNNIITFKATNFFL